MHARDETASVYTVKRRTRTDDDATIAKALAILGKRLAKLPQVFSDPAEVKAYLRLRVASLEHEVFCGLFLTSEYRLIADVTLSIGTLSQASVYPREVVKTALAHNASAVVLYHNHPSGNSAPSRADEYLTQRLKAALGVVDVRVLDHLVIGATVTSFAEQGLL